ncbi:carbon-nitrogen hydrolase family protein [Nocardioides daejeonensis]|uniref:carbon-nitrogen hydrolase family protein n=1 Tax=Nocardioides daejeonensis TaxID=1046556 RepID=UPI000D74D9DE|nr:carbon-nitrogen hydrolase family protein [Nocardioides daejeonensis]
MNETSNKVRVAAIQLDAALGDSDRFLADSERLATAAASEGAAWVVLPEFFTTGMGFEPRISRSAPPAEGEPAVLLARLAAAHGIHIGGSALVRDADGHVRNAFFLFGPDGLLGRHDKDLPTMWESALYVGGTDPGRFDAAGLSIGVALCWELMRSQTVARLGGQVDLVLGGSGWWSMPDWPLLSGVERRNLARANAAPAAFARHVGAPVVHAAHAGRVECDFLGTPFRYRGRLEGGTQVCDADGRVLAFRGRDDGAGIVTADVPLVRRPPTFASDRFWLQKRGAIAAAAWVYHNRVGRRFYERAHRARLAEVQR